MDICKLIGSNVRRQRLRSGFSQEELAARMGMNQAYVSKLESGKLNPTITTVALTARALEVNTILLFLVPEHGNHGQDTPSGQISDFVPSPKTLRSKGAIKKR